jgi:class 3 adenylate cyclase
LHPAFGKDRFQICIGLNSGTVADTRVAGSGLSFRASGTVRMFTTRLREFAGPGQVLISGETYAEVSDMVRVRSIGTVRTNSDGDKAHAYCVISLVEDE